MASNYSRIFFWNIHNKAVDYSDSDDLEKKRSVIMGLGEKLSIVDRTIQFTPNKFFIPLEKMNESKAELSEMVRTESGQIKTPAFQHGSISWLPTVDSNSRTAYMLALR